MNRRRQRNLPDGDEIKISEALEIPLGSIPGYTHIELESNRTATVDGCIGILEYGENSIKINTAKLVVHICGCDLTVISMQNGQAVVTGCITGIDFTS